MLQPGVSALQHLTRLRLIVPAATEPESGSSPTGPLARIHRLVQGAIKARLTEVERWARLRRLHDYADERAARIQSHSPPPWIDWELLCLRDLALSRIENLDRGGWRLADQIEAPLARQGRSLDFRELWRQSAELSRHRLELAPEMPRTPSFLPILSSGWETWPGPKTICWAPAATMKRA